MSKALHSVAEPHTSVHVSRSRFVETSDAPCLKAARTHELREGHAEARRSPLR